MTARISSVVNLDCHGIMAVLFLPFVMERIIRVSVSSFFDASVVKFFGGGFSTLAAKVFPSPLSP